MLGFVFVFFSIFPTFSSPIAVVGEGRGGQHPHITLPHLVVSAIPTLDLPRLEAVRPSAYIDKTEPIYLLKDFKPCSVDSREPWMTSEQGSHLVGTANMACGCLSSSRPSRPSLSPDRASSQMSKLSPAMTSPCHSL